MRNIITTTIIILWTISTSFGQQVWPGDINNNGIVNNIDVLYWAVAKDSTGEERPGASTNWVGQDLPDPLWEQSFPNSLNYAYADCNGDGIVDDDDKDVIDANFGETRPEDLVPDEYQTGNPGEDPILTLSAEITRVAPDGTLLADLSLGTETDSISQFFGIAFKLVYDTDVVASQGNAIKLDIEDEAWINGSGGTANQDVTQLVQNNRESGIVEIAIVRKKDGPVSGFGKIGTVSIVMEDIFTGKVTSEVSVTDIKMIDETLAESPVAPSKLSFEVDTTLTSSRELIRTSGIRLYPNPAGGEEVNIELDNQQERILRVQMFDAIGRRLMDRKAGRSNYRESIKLDQYPNGMYIMKVFSDQSVYVRSFFRKRE